MVVINSNIDQVIGAMPFGYCTLRENTRFVGCNNQRALHQFDQSVIRYAKL